MKLQDLTLKQISTLCANQDYCFKNNIHCPLWSTRYERCSLNNLAPYSIGQEEFDIEIDDNLLKGAELK